MHWINPNSTNTETDTPTPTSEKDDDGCCLSSGGLTVILAVLGLIAAFALKNYLGIP